MKKSRFKRMIITGFVLAMLATTFTGCKKGEEDPLLSVNSRKDRVTNYWTLDRYFVNGEKQNTNNVTLEYNIRDDNTVTEHIEGSMFGVVTRETNQGTWNFLDEKQRLQLVIEDDSEIYDIDRLAKQELWVSIDQNGDHHEFFFMDK